jgi:uncharacterized Rmd1/YagE family protein
MTDSAGAEERAQSMRLRAIVLGDRIETAKLERADRLSTAPLAYGVGGGFAVIFRYGVAVLGGLSTEEEESTLAALRPHVSGGPVGIEEEVAEVVCDGGSKEEGVPPGGPIEVKELSLERLFVVADALAKSAALGRDERLVSAVFDIVDPLAHDLFRTGRVPGNRKRLLQLVGQALLVQQRVSGRIAAEDKPDVLWDRPELERLYARLNDEYELADRGQSLTHKLGVLQETARILTDLVDVQRGMRLEATIVALIVVEIALTLLMYVLRAPA